MAQKLFLKTSENTIQYISPSPKASIQKDLAAGKDAFIEHCKKSHLYDVGRGQPNPRHNAHISWATGVKDFANLSDEEHKNLILCDAPANHQYHHWIDEDTVDVCHPLRNAWTDIDAAGNVTYDPVKAKALVVAALTTKVTAARKLVESTSDAADDTTVAESALAAAKQALGNAKVATVASHDDVVNILMPMLK